MNRRRPAALLLMIMCALTFLHAVPAEAATYTQIEGTGSTWSDNIVQQWIADVSSSGMSVVYTQGGSSKGRKDFAQGTTDFAISEIPYQGKDEQGNADTSNGRDYAYLPIVAGGTAFTYQLKVGGKMVRNLRLSGDTLTKIFTNKITNWADPAITKDNNGRALPSLAITPVVRSDGSGTTAQLTTWMNNQYPSLWKPFFGRSGLTSYYPRKGRSIGAAGSDQVMNTIAGSAGNGTIGYVEYSFPLNKTASDGKPFPVVKVLNRGGYYVEPTQYNVAVALTKARINNQKSSPLYLTQILDGVYAATDPRAYPLSSYSYMIIPTARNDRRMTTAKRQTLADFMYYSLCTGQSKAGTYGYSPLPLNLVQAGFTQLARLKTADPKVDLAKRDVASCNNPTFVKGDLSKNKLAEIAPAPATCDKLGAGPCGTDTGTGKPSTDASNAAAGGAAGTGAAAAGTPGAGTAAPGAAGTGAAAPTGAPGAVDPETGLPTGATATGAASDGSVYANPTELVAGRAGDTRTFGMLAAAELVALIVVPGVVATWMRRRRSAGGTR
ncbi:substrate-binding domain-containing protein [Solicola sp. PLA-1-18]|uniref:substrate-binding domain-containing protein n=1 Tax=Solicola sp. PLA-1-18 TaxID=3380532 RepID=UPI003B7840E4